MNRYIFLVIITILLGSCNSSKPTVYTPKKPVTKQKTNSSRSTKPVATSKPENTSSGNSEVLVATSKTKVTQQTIFDYVLQYKDIAMGNMKSYGIPASIILAQGILESGAGYGRLAASANNHFGIKCHKEWTGEKVYHDDDALQECFRKYDKASESYRDHALFLTSRGRYSKLFSLPKGDYEAWARGLRAAGYATDPKYPEKLILYIEKYKLHQYDNQVLGISENENPTTAEPKSEDTSLSDNELLYEIQKGDTLYSLSKKFNMSVDDIMKMNGMTQNALSIGQQIKIKK
jgi:flagellum-specific peptidoglycan hydrolase FlgJ